MFGYLYAFVSGIILTLIPLACYLLYLVYLHRRQKPIALNGRADAFLLFAGLSGFWIIGGPIFMSLLDSGLREFWTDGNLHSLKHRLEIRPWTYTLYSLSYLSFLSSILLSTLIHRSNVIVIYNIELNQLKYCCKQAVQEIGATANLVNDIRDDLEIQTGDERQGDVEIDHLEFSRTGTLRWNGNEALGKQFYQAVRQQFENLSCNHSPIARWLMAAATVLIVFVCCVILLAFLLLQGND